MKKQIVSASIGGTITAVVVCPFDVVKARLQAQIDPIDKKGFSDMRLGTISSNIVNFSFVGDTFRPSTSSVITNRPLRFTGTWDAFYKIVKHEGLLTLFRGLPPSLILSVPSSVIYFTSYEHLKEFFATNTGLGIIGVPIFSGFGARVVTASFTAPLELIRTNLQATPPDKHNKGWIRLASNIINKAGYRQLWVGLPPTILRDAPFSAIYWASFEYMKAFLWSHKEPKDNKTSSFFTNFICGALAGMFAAAFTNPIDVVKTRRQLYLEPAEKGEKSITSMGIFRSIIREEGFRGFSKGLLPRMVKVAPACAVMISSYEWCKLHLSI